MYEKPNLPKQMHHLRLCHNRIRCSNHTLVCHMENESRLGFIFTSGFQKHLIAAFLRKSKSHPRMLHGRTRSPNASVEFIFTKISRPLQIWLFQGVSKNSHLSPHIRSHSRHTALCMKPIGQRTIFMPLIFPNRPTIANPLNEIPTFYIMAARESITVLNGKGGGCHARRNKN